ncbi:MAG: transglycosylase SLT domain-containing protein [Dokdonella sp.]
MTCAFRTRLRSASLGAGLLLMAACASPPTRPIASSTPVAPVLPAQSTTAESAPAGIAAPVAIAPEHSPWPRLRARFAMQGCDYRPEVQRWARYYTHGARAFVASWKQALPFLLLVADQLEQRDLPGEFALLPYLESGYQPLPSHGDRPAGMWQLVPDTAHEAGLSIAADYDGRLDALASTTAALDLLARYFKEFADWRLADMAFNSGEFRVKKLLGERDARSLSAEELGHLAFNRITHEHLDRLLALACVVDDPARFNITLPEPDDDDRLDVVTLDAAMDLRLAARFAGIDIGDMRRWNAGYRRSRMSAMARHRLLLPATHVQKFHSAADAVPFALWSDWREQRAARTSGIGSWATQLGIPVAVLAAANAIGENATVTSSTQLLLPGREAEPMEIAAKGPGSLARQHVIIAGDTLSRVAQRYSIPLKRLKQLNPHAAGTLHLGDRLHLGED